MTRFNNVRVKATFDQALTDSDNIEAFTPNTGSPQKVKAAQAGMVYFYVGEREYSEGNARLDINGGESFDGFQTVTYKQAACHPDSYAWLIANYRGQVTASFPLDGTTYDDFNCLLRFTKRPSQVVDGWYEVLWQFTILETA